MSYFITMITMLFVFSMSAAAKEIIVINDYEVRFRTEATTQSGIIANLNKNEELTLLDKNGPAGNGCNGPWYKC